MLRLWRKRSDSLLSQRNLLIHNKILFKLTFNFSLFCSLYSLLYTSNLIYLPPKLVRTWRLQRLHLVLNLSLVCVSSHSHLRTLLPIHSFQLVHVLVLHPYLLRPSLRVKLLFLMKRSLRYYILSLFTRVTVVSLNSRKFNIQGIVFTFHERMTSLDFIQNFKDIVLYLFRLLFDLILVLFLPVQFR